MTSRSLFVGLLLLTGTQSCTTYRILRYRQPDARNQGMFPSRPVHKPDTPFQFARAATLRTDLDTVSVRDTDGRRIPFRQYMEAHAILAFVVIRRDTIVYETYRDGFEASTIHSSFSVAKSVLSTLVGIAVGEGAIKSLDDPVTKYVRELAGKPAFEGVTVRHLIEMKSGLRFTKTGNGLISDFRSDDAHIYYAANIKHEIAKARRELPPGSKWVYKDTDAELLGWVLSEATGKTVAAYTEEKLWKKIGAEHDATWSLDNPNGLEKVSSGFNATARDYARIGRLMLKGGQWNGVQVVPSEWARASAAVDTSRVEPEISVWWKMQHTLYWWHAVQPPTGDFFADGSNGQRIYVDPATETIIVQLANDSRQDFPFRKVTAYLLGKPYEYPRLIPALVRQAAMNFGRDSIRPVFNRLNAERLAQPERYVLTESGMNAVGRLFIADKATIPLGVEVLELVTELYPRSAAGFVNLSDAYLERGDRERAVGALRRAAELAPNDGDIARRLTKVAGR